MDVIRVWRICHKKYRSTAFSGEGARLYGGRFNSEGFSVVYTSATLSLSILEILVQTNSRSFFEQCVVFHADIPSELIHNPKTENLPKEWDRIPHGKATQTFGDNWIREREKPVMKIPSVVVPIEHNYVINPSHKHFSKIQLSEPLAMTFDKRLAGS